MRYLFPMYEHGPKRNQLKIHEFSKQHKNTRKSICPVWLVVIVVSHLLIFISMLHLRKRNAICIWVMTAGLTYVEDIFYREQFWDSFHLSISLVLISDILFKSHLSTAWLPHSQLLRADCRLLVILLHCARTLVLTFEQVLQQSLLFSVTAPTCSGSSSEHVHDISCILVVVHWRNVFRPLQAL